MAVRLCSHTLKQAARGQRCVLTAGDKQDAAVTSTMLCCTYGRAAWLAVRACNSQDKSRPSHEVFVCAAAQRQLRCDIALSPPHRHAGPPPQPNARLPTHLPGTACTATGPTHAPDREDSSAAGLLNTSCCTPADVVDDWWAAYWYLLLVLRLLWMLLDLVCRHVVELKQHALELPRWRTGACLECLEQRDLLESPGAALSLMFELATMNTCCAAALKALRPRLSQIWWKTSICLVCIRLGVLVAGSIT